MGSSRALHILYISWRKAARKQEIASICAGQLSLSYEHCVETCVLPPVPDDPNQAETGSTCRDLSFGNALLVDGGTCDFVCKDAYAGSVSGVSCTAMNTLSATTMTCSGTVPGGREVVAASNYPYLHTHPHTHITHTHTHTRCLIPYSGSLTTPRWIPDIWPGFPAWSSQCGNLDRRILRQSVIATMRFPMTWNYIGWKSWIDFVHQNVDRTSVSPPPLLPGITIIRPQTPIGNHQRCPRPGSFVAIVKEQMQYIFSLKCPRYAYRRLLGTHYRPRCPARRYTAQVRLPMFILVGVLTPKRAMFTDAKCTCPPPRSRQEGRPW